MNGEDRRIAAVAIGASWGGIAALLEVLPKLPAGLAAPVFVVVHLPAQEKSLLVDVFSSRCMLPVKEAEHGETIAERTVYFAPPDYHLLVERGHTLSLSVDAPVNFSRPSIDVLFESAADAYGESLLAIVLTGANEDGARGVAAVCRAGGLALIQERASAAAPMMPAAALAACEGARELPLGEIAGQVETLCSQPWSRS